MARGGATTLVLLLAKLLRSSCIPVTMMVGDDGNNPNFAELDIDVVALQQKKLLNENPFKAAIAGIDNRAARTMIADWVCRNDTPETVYHVNVWAHILSPSIFMALRKVARRTIIHAHDFFHACPNGAFMDYQKGEACQRIPLSGACIATHCDRRSYVQKLWRVARQARLLSAMGRDVPWGKIILIHEKMFSGFQRAGYQDGTLQTIRNPVSPFTTHRVAAERNRSFYFIGRLEEEKGPQDAAAAARLAGVPLEVIGDGRLRASLQAQYPEVTFHGWRSRDEIGPLITNARALVVPSRYPEPFGLVAAETAASGLPLLLTETALLAQETVEQKIGVACDTRNIPAFADALRLMAEKPSDEVRAMSERAFSGKVKLANSETEWIEALLEVYERLLHQNRVAQQGSLFNDQSPVA